MKKTRKIILVFGNHVAASLLLMLAGFTGRSDADEIALQQILHARSNVVATNAQFEQTVTSEFLTEPVLSYGTLHYSAPDVLSLDIGSPVSFRIEMRAGEVSISRGRKAQQINLTDHPVISSYLTGIRSFLAGDKELLEKNYLLTSTGGMPSWSLSLVPQQNSEIVSMTITGSGVDVSEIVIEKSTGDRIVLRITETRSSQK